MQEFSQATREKNLQHFKTESEYDLVIIGGGIVGAGVARDAASRGMKVALIEKNDFAWGTSSRSSKLIHGGIRYLENLEFGLVFEALSERERLYHIAPHLVHPLKFILPLYKDSRVGMFKMSLGMWLYDTLALFQSGLHERLDKNETLERAPHLKSEKLLGSFVYPDAYMDDDRLVIETLRSAHSYGAHIANFVEATGVLYENPKSPSPASGQSQKTFGEDQLKIIGIVCKNNKGGEEFTIRAKHVVSSVGPWTDELGSKLLGDWKKKLRPSKGVHITLRKDKIQLNDAVVMPADRDNRIVFGIPRHEMFIIGTTDTDFSGSPDKVQAEPEDISYLLGIANEFFPGANITAQDILAHYAGVRPLVRDDAAGSAGKTSREHEFFLDPRGITFIAGGKYTTYRLISEEAVELVLSQFSMEERMKFSQSKSLEPLNPEVSPANLQRAKGSQEKLASLCHLTPQEVGLIIDRHGLEGVTMIDEAKRSKLGLWEVEALHAARTTMCLNLTDFFTRRTPLYLSEKDHGLSLLDLVGYHMQNELGWSDEELKKQKDTYKEFCQKN